MTDRVFFTLKIPWKDKKYGTVFTDTDTYQGQRTKEGIVVTGASAHTHTIPYNAINEDFLNPAYGKKK